VTWLFNFFAGFLIYVFYGLKHSEERKLSNERGESRQLDTHQDSLARQSKTDPVLAKYSYEPSSGAPDIPQHTKF
jgi:hypothetical protein